MRDEMTTYARQFAETGRDSKATDFVASLETMQRDVSDARADAGEVRRADLPDQCPAGGRRRFRPVDAKRCTINGSEVNPSLGWVMTTPFNMLSRCPVLSVPSGHASNGVPTGIQIVGRTYCDADVFRAAMAYETAQGAWYGDAGNRPRL